MSETKKFADNIKSLHRYSKRVIVILIDIGLCIFSTWLAFTLRLEKLIFFEDFNLYPALISIIIAIPIFWIFGLYRTIFRYTGFSIAINIFASVSVYGVFYFLIIGIYSIEGVPRSVGILQPMLLFFGVIISRISIKYLLDDNYSFKSNSAKKNVLVYGAGESGRQLVVAIENSIEFKVVGFLDDNQHLHRQSILGKTVYPPEKLENLVKIKNINLVFLALPSLSRTKRNQIIENLNQYKLTVKTLPSISEIVNDRITISDIKDLNINDLLNREEIKPNKVLLNKNINLKTVLITGAGGSIGSELSRQILKLEPKKILLLEINEFALYKIYEELKNLNKNLKIVSLLVDAKDQSRLEKIIEIFKVDTVYHTAAYKHVPIVEENICEGVKNNVFSTLAIAKASINKKVSNLVLISSDKAVRPTNIMGATKRLSELCMQAVYNFTKDNNTNFSIVRFGNVLESSGSVIPKFKNQIKEGGPVTLTHKDVTRYFMTVTEAAQLVIQAGAMGKHCEVFVLDMGSSVKIIDLIHKMIKLSGFSIKDNNNKDGDIEVKVIGLRPGEKLFEELLIGNNPEKTTHERIQKAKDPYIPFDELKLSLDDLSLSIDNNDILKVKKILKKLIPDYVTDTNIVDHIYQAQENLNFNSNKIKKVIH